MKKFENISVSDFMKTIVALNTEHYWSDLDDDMERLRKSMSSQDPMEKKLLWLCRKSGTWLFEETHVFTKETMAYTTTMFYHRNYKNSDELDRFLLYFIDLTGTSSGQKEIFGDVYVYDYPTFCEHLENAAVEEPPVLAVYENGVTRREVRTKSDRTPHPVFGQFLYSDEIPGADEPLKKALAKEAAVRKAAYSGSVDRYLSRLAKKRGKSLEESLQRKGSFFEGSVTYA